MKSLLLLVLVCCHLYWCNALCFLGQPQPQDLALCTQYADSACCTPEIEARVIAALGEFAEVYGTGGCLQNYGNFSCAMACSPVQTSFVAYSSGLTGYVDAAFADGWFESCKNVCLTTDGETVQDLFLSVGDFVASFDTTNNPDFVPDILNPNIFQRVGTMPGGTNFNGIAEPQVDELPGCPDVTFWTANGKSSTDTSSDTSSSATTSPPDDRLCPLKANQQPSAETLAFCTQYDNSACCNAFGDEQLQTNAVNKIGPLFGDGNCFENLKRFLCAWTCGPFQEEVMHVQGMSILNVTVFVDVTFANALRDSCRKVCLPFGGGRTVEQQFPNGASFVLQFESRNDPNYVVDALHPYLNYAFGLSPNGGNINSDKVTLLEGDADGCGGNSSDAATIAMPFLLFLVSLAIF